MLCYYLIGATAALTGLYARLCHAFLVVSVCLLCLLVEYNLYSNYVVDNFFVKLWKALDKIIDGFLMAYLEPY